MPIQTRIADDPEEPMREVKVLNKIRNRVKYILERYPSARGDDTILVYRYYKTFHNKQVKLTFSQFESLMRVPAFESITRNRRAIQRPNKGDGELLPTVRTRRKRAMREDIMIQMYGD